MGYYNYNYIEFEEPPEGETVMFDESITLKITNILYSLIGTLIIPTFIYLYNDEYLLYNFLRNYFSGSIFLFYLIYTVLKEFRTSKGRINKVLHNETYLKMVIDKIEIKINYNEIENIETINVDEGIVRFKFNEKSQLYKKFKNGKSNKLKIENSRIVYKVRFKDVIHFYENKIIESKKNKSF